MLLDTVIGGKLRVAIHERTEKYVVSTLGKGQEHNVQIRVVLYW